MARPRSFDTEHALAAAAQVFLLRGFEGASLEHLTEAMGINKPSLYAAFGDKSALYAQVLSSYALMARTAMTAALRTGDSLEDSARALLRGAVDVYAPVHGHRLGCLIATTATTVAGNDPAVKNVLAAFLAEVDGLVSTVFKERFGATMSDAEIVSAAELTSASVYALAIRARAGTPRKKLLEIAGRAAQAIAASADRTASGGVGRKGRTQAST